MRALGASSVVAVSTAAALALPLSAAQQAAAADGFVVSTGDGLSLRFDHSGRTTSVLDQGRRVSGAAAPLLALRRVGGGAELLPNRGLEQDRDHDGVPDRWRLTGGDARPVLVAGGHGGRRSVRVDLPRRGTSGTLRTTVAVTGGRYLRIGALVRSAGVTPSAPTTSTSGVTSPVAVRAVMYDGRRVLATRTASGYTGDAGWHRVAAGFRTPAGTTSVQVVAGLVGGAGRVWFDDLSLVPTFARSWSTGTASTHARDGGGVGVRTVLPGQGLAVAAAVTATDGAVHVHGVVSADSDHDVPVQVRVRVPVGGDGWWWGDTPRRERRVAGSATYSSLTRWNLQQASRYPMATVHDARTALTLALPLDQPRLTRFSYHAGLLTAELDLGISPASRFGRRAPFDLVLFRSGGAWGLRSAIGDYYRLFPAFFRRRSDPAREGGWFGRADLDAIGDHAADFGLGLGMVALGTGNDGGDTTWGTGYLPWDAERGIYATAYTHQWGYKHPNPDSPTVPAYGVELARLRAEAAVEPTDPAGVRGRDRALATLHTGARDLNGRLLYEVYRGYLQHFESLHPQDRLDWDEVSQTHQVQRAVDLAAATGQPLAAIHLDSVSGMRRWGAADDYDRGNWAQAAYPLTFSYDTGRVADRLAFGVAGRVARLSRWVHEHGMFLSANFNGSDARSATWFGAQGIDWFGIEQGLADKAAASNDRYTDVDSFALAKRVLAGTRPVSTIDARMGDGSLDGAAIRRRLQQNLFYGIFPGIGKTGRWTDEQRTAFAACTPLFDDLAVAGWRPVTLARSSDPQVWLERFGDPGSARWFLTLRNESGQDRVATVTLDRSAGVPASLVERVTSSALTPVGRTFTVPVPAGSTRLVQVSG
ncbi:hypothetical protein [Nocardioides marmoribigeumensis]|uniref:Uncharacterized protein n=1 Tax=Nocardioides marmoribigeumensis TaxID=433649 RepID=A0ABU2BU45_9ACTN|nr:hypothetical protein [Nocardioides marmoribigeumensis]MDR7362145.1 hypothetical protein [Nocardioides marmoribigeumensis]